MSANLSAASLALNLHVAREANANVIATASPLPAAKRPVVTFVPPKPSKHVGYLEGLRGLAALAVVFDHMFRSTLVVSNQHGWKATLRDALGVITQGRWCVDLFIVLSGYLLMRPVVRAGMRGLPDGLKLYLYRRARRILPPYYAALAICLILLACIPALRQPMNWEWQDAVRPHGPYGRSNLIAHVLMVHNLSSNWASKIDPAMWTVATEWQIYFLFPLILLPAYAFFGAAGALTAGLGLGLGGYLAFGHGQSAAPWYLGLFAMGMVAAARERAGLWRRYDMLIFGSLAAIFFAAYFAITGGVQFNYLHLPKATGIEDLWRYNWELDLIVGIAAACFLCYCSANVQAADLAERPRSLAIRFLSSKALVGLGVFSYSLYLIHEPFIPLMQLVFNSLSMGPYRTFAGMIIFGIPLILLITYGFHLLFERPFMARARVGPAQ